MSPTLSPIAWFLSFAVLREGVAGLLVIGRRTEKRKPSDFLALNLSPC